MGMALLKQRHARERSELAAALPPDPVRERQDGKHFDERRELAERLATGAKVVDDVLDTGFVPARIIRVHNRPPRNVDSRRLGAVARRGEGMHLLGQVEDLTGELEELLVLLILFLHRLPLLI